MASQDLVTETLELIRMGGLLAGERPVLVMLSGGRDSVCLVDVCVTLLRADRVRALHVNYGLRARAEAEEDHCRELCAGLEVALHVHKATKPEDAGNTQAWARTVRYDAAEELARTEDALIATGHTASDQVETILYRLAASPGRRALLGMAPAAGRVVRPLLAITREQTGSYCRARSLDWCEDESNDTDTYARGRVRAGLVPALRAVHPAAESSVLATARLLREETELLENLVDTELEGQRSIQTERLASLHPALARMIVVRLAEQAAGTFVPQAGDRVGEILGLAARGTAAELHVGGLVSAVIEHGRLSMKRIAPHYPSPNAH